MGHNCSAQPFFWLKWSSAPYVMASTLTSIVPAWCSRVEKGWSGTNDTGGCNLVGFWELPPKQLDWCLDGCIFCKLPPDPVVPVAFFLFFGWCWLYCIYIVLYLSTTAGQNPHHLNLHTLFFLCHFFFWIPYKWLKIQDLQNAWRERFQWTRQSLILIMDPYHFHLQPRKLREAGGTGRLPDTGAGRSRLGMLRVDPGLILEDSAGMVTCGGHDMKLYKLVYSKTPRTREAHLLCWCLLYLGSYVDKRDNQFLKHTSSHSWQFAGKFSTARVPACRLRRDPRVKQAMLWCIVAASISARTAPVRMVPWTHVPKAWQNTA